MTDINIIVLVFIAFGGFVLGGLFVFLFNKWRYSTHIIDKFSNKEKDAVISAVFSSYPFQFWVCDIKGTFLYTNTSFNDFWGAVVGENIKNIPESQNPSNIWSSAFADALQNKCISTEISFTHNNKIHHYIRVISPITLNGKISGYLGTHIDITNQKNAELTIKASEKKFHTIFNNSPDTISLVDYESGRYVDVNSCFLKNTESELHEVIGKTRQELNVWAHDKERIRYEDLIRTEGSVQNFEMQWNIAGGVRSFLVSSEVIEIEGRKTILTISKDVDLIHRMQRALAESERKFRTIFDASNDGIVISSLENQFLEANDAFLKLTGYNSAEDLVTHKNLELIHPDYHQALYVRQKQMLEGVNLPTIEVEAIGVDGRKGWLEMTSCLVDYNGEKAVLSHVRDIQERKHLSQQTLKLIVEVEENERRRIAFDLHDDVGPLLSSLNMYVSLLARRPELEKYRAEIQNIQTILKESIAAVRAISNNISPQVLSTYGLSAAVKNFCETNQQLIRIEYHSDFDQKRLPEAMEITLYRIIKELINNTIKYANASKSSIRLQNIANKVVFCYTDDGCGFDWDETLKTSNKNLGLKSIINRVRTMNGTYEVVTSPGNGLSLTITLKQ